MIKKNLNQILFVCAFVTLALVSRFVSHQWNFTMMGSVALFTGAFFKRKQDSFLVVILSLLISDFFIGFHNQMFVVYGSFLAMSYLGTFLKPDSGRPQVIGTSLAASLLFFIFTNFSVWLENSLYPQTLNGLVECYLMGLPFFRNQLLSDLLFTSVFFEMARALLPRTSGAIILKFLKS